MSDSTAQFSRLFRTSSQICVQNTRAIEKNILYVNKQEVVIVLLGSKMRYFFEHKPES